MMYGLRQALLNGAYQTGAWRLIERSFGGMGAILMGHRVVKKKEESLAQYLTVTESFLDQPRGRCPTMRSVSRARPSDGH